MMAANALIALAEAGVVLVADAGRLRFRSPTSALTDDLRADVAACRPALVALVAAGGVLPVERGSWPEPWRTEVEERAGILQFDGGLSREDAEREAERLLRVQHARAFVARHALVVAPDVAVAARPGSGPHR